MQLLQFCLMEKQVLKHVPHSKLGQGNSTPSAFLNDPSDLMTSSILQEYECNFMTRGSRLSYPFGHQSTWRTVALAMRRTGPRIQMSTVFDSDLILMSPQQSAQQVLEPSGHCALNRSRHLKTSSCPQQLSVVQLQFFLRAAWRFSLI